MATFGTIGEQNAGTGGQVAFGADRQGGALISPLHSRFYQQAKRGRLFWARAVVTAPVIFSTAAATGGPLLYNGTSAASGVDAVLLGFGIGITTASGVAGAIGIATGVTTAPASTTAIDSTTNAYVGGAASQCTAYRVGTPSAAATQFFPFGDIHTGATSVHAVSVPQWFFVEGGLVIPPGSFASVSPSATLTSAVLQVSLLWEEVPV